MDKTKQCPGCGRKFVAGPRDYGKRWERRVFCCRGCRNTIHTRNRPLADRFWAKVDRSAGRTACWPWTASTDSFGYGRFWTGEKVDGSNRVAWELTHGPIPEGEGYHGLCVLHKCDNPGCCNPDHLFLGSNATNLKDMTAKGRHGMAKLSAGDALAIRKMYETGRFTHAEIADAFGMSRGMVSMIINRKNWTHI